MAYRDELHALRERLALLEAENRRLGAALRGAGPVSARPPDPRWYSVQGGEPTTVTIRNASLLKVELYWLSYDGRERGTGTLVPGGEVQVETYIGFCWRFVDAATGEILEHLRVQEPREVLVHDGADALPEP